jgi:hypothetical protein
MAVYKTKYCKKCRKAHPVRLYLRDYGPPLEVFYRDACDCGNPLSKDTTSYHESEEEYQRMLSEIEVIVIE